MNTIFTTAITVVSLEEEESEEPVLVVLGGRLWLALVFCRALIRVVFTILCLMSLRFRRQKEKFGASELRRQANRMNFGEVGDRSACFDFWVFLLVLRPIFDRCCY